jgi:hypothetical protein
MWSALRTGQLLHWRKLRRAAVRRQLLEWNVVLRERMLWIGGAVLRERGGQRRVHRDESATDLPDSLRATATEVVPLSRSLARGPENTRSARETRREAALAVVAEVVPLE